MDKNTVIGFVLLAALFFGYFYYNKIGQDSLEKQRKHIEDSIASLKPKIDTSIARLDSIKREQTLQQTSLGSFKQDSTATEQFTVVENEVLKITFTNKGGQPKTIELKNFKTFDHKPLILQNGVFNKLSYAVNTSANQTAQTGDLLFSTSQPVTSADGKKTITFSIGSSDGQTIQHQYTLSPNNYMVDFNINLTGADKLITQNILNLNWQTQANTAEKDVDYERSQSQIDFIKDGDYDSKTIVAGDDDKKLTTPVDWITLKQQFFATSLIAKNKFESADLQWHVPKDTATHIVAQVISNLKVKLPTASVANIPLQLYYGPSDYKILKSYGNQLHNIVPLGSGIFAFVKYINRGFILPVFDFMHDHIASLGLVIALLTIIIRLLISPLTYQSYLSGAKMKLIKPEIDALKAKHTDPKTSQLDQQVFGMEQMKLFRTVGIKPLNGCIPALLQIPIFFALYNFFNSNILLRGQSFLWSKDLSAYDSIYNIPFHVPFYGSHVSLFTILAVVTSLLISIYGMANMQDNSNPVMKYLPFIFPIILLGVFNKLPSALTWYYTVSNVITLVIQFVIQKYIINHEKILAEMEANKKKPPTMSKWQEKIQAMQETNKNVQNLKNKTGANTNTKK